MRMRRAPYALRFTVPILFVLGVFLAFGIAGLFELHTSTRDVEIATDERARAYSELLASELEAALRGGQLARAQATLLRSTADPQLSQALLVDDEDAVLIGAPLESRGLRLEASAPTEWRAHAAKARLRMQVVTALSEDRDRLVCVEPVILAPAPDELVSSRIGVLLLEFRLRETKAVRQAAVLQRVAWSVIPIAAIGGLIALGFSLHLNRRMRRLIATTRRVSRGDWSSAAVLSGSDELATLGREIDGMSQLLEARTSDLLASESRMREVLESLDEVLWTAADDPMRLTHLSPAARRVFGREVAEILEAPELPLAAVHEEDRARVRSSYEGLRDGERHEIEYRVVRPDGSVRWVRERARAAFESGALVRIDGILTDETDRKLAELARERLETELQHAQRVELLGRIAGGVAHEFNNVLTVIIGQAEILGAKRSSQEARDLSVEAIRDSAARAARLTSQLLALGRKQVLSMDVLDLGELLREVARMIRPAIGERYDLEVEIASEGLLVEGDTNLLTNVLFNLVLNARDAMPGGGPVELRLYADHEPATGGPTGEPARELVVVEVRDRGTGVPPEVLPHIFEPFFTTKPPGKGTGLGLSTVEGIVEQLGGRIRVHSEPGRGTSFRVELPRSFAQVSGTPRQVGDVELRERQGDSATVLLVEDEAAVREMLRAALEEEGYRVLAVGSAAEALELVQTQALEPDVLITDVVLPGVSGVDLARQLRADGRRLPALFLSGYAADDVQNLMSPGGQDEFLGKPFRPSALLDRVRALLERARVDSTGI